MQLGHCLIVIYKRSFLCRINPQGAGAVLKASCRKCDGVRVLCSAPSKQTPKGVQATADNALVVAHFAGLAQLIEHLFCNQTARGSSPRFSTNAYDAGKYASASAFSSRLGNRHAPTNSACHVADSVIQGEPCRESRQYQRFR